MLGSLLKHETLWCSMVFVCLLAASQIKHQEYLIKTEKTKRLQIQQIFSNEISSINKRLIYAYKITNIIDLKGGIFYYANYISHVLEDSSVIFQI